MCIQKYMHLFYSPLYILFLESNIFLKIKFLSFFRLYFGKYRLCSCCFSLSLSLNVLNVRVFFPRKPMRTSNVCLYQRLYYLTRPECKFRKLTRSRHRLNPVQLASNPERMRSTGDESAMAQSSWQINRLEKKNLTKLSRSFSTIRKQFTASREKFIYLARTQVSLL